MSAESGRAFARDTLAVGATQVLLKIQGLVTLSLILKLLGTAAYGVWSQTLTLVGLLGALLSMNLHLPLVRFVAADPRRGAAVYSTLLFATLALTGTGALALQPIAPRVGELAVTDAELAPFLRIGALLMLFSNVSLLNLNVYRATGRFLRRSALEMVAAAVQVAGIVWLLRTGSGLLNVLSFMAAWTGVVATAQTAHILSFLGFARPELSILKEAFRYALPLLPTSISIWALDRLDRLVIGNLLGAAAVGVYSAHYSLASSLTLFQAPLQTTLFPKLAALWERNREKAGRYSVAASQAYLVFAIPVVAALPVVGRPVLTLLGNAEVAAERPLTTFFIGGGVALWGISVLQAVVFHAAARPGWVAVVTAGTALLNLFLNLVLVPRMGVCGAALATLVAYAVTCATFVVLSRGLVPARIEVRFLLRSLLAAGVMAGLLAALKPSGAVGLATALSAGALVYLALLFGLRRLLPSATEDEMLGLMAPWSRR